MFSNKNEMVKYCRQKNIRKYSSLNRPELLLHIIKSVYFRSLKDYGNKRAYEELRDTYHSKTEEYKDKIKILEEKIINTEESSTHDEMMSLVNGESIEDLTPNRVKGAILYTINVIQSIKKSNKGKTKRQFTKELINKGAKFFTTSRRGAELIKYASNAFLATKITFINELANLCEKSNINIEEISLGMGYND